MKFKKKKRRRHVSFTAPCKLALESSCPEMVEQEMPILRSPWWRSWAIKSTHPEDLYHLGFLWCELMHFFLIMWSSLSWVSVLRVEILINIPWHLFICLTSYGFGVPVCWSVTLLLTPQSACPSLHSRRLTILDCITRVLVISGFWLVSTSCGQVPVRYERTERDIPISLEAAFSALEAAVPLHDCNSQKGTLFPGSIPLFLPYFFSPGLVWLPLLSASGCPKPPHLSLLFCHTSTNDLSSSQSPLSNHVQGIVLSSRTLSHTCATCLTPWPSFVRSYNILQPWTINKAIQHIKGFDEKFSPANLLVDFGWVRDWQDFYANNFRFCGLCHLCCNYNVCHF